tara:strand:- start:148 stop:324 length:177 start_codon:yes stop_codon:yes gene_type:complete
VKDEDKELTLEELELVCGGMNYSGFYKYRAKILNFYEIKDKGADLKWKKSYYSYCRQE